MKNTMLYKMARLIDVSSRQKGVQCIDLSFDTPTELRDVANLVAEACQAHLKQRGIERKVTSRPAGDGTPSYVIEAERCPLPLYELFRVGSGVGPSQHFVLADYADEGSLGDDAPLLIPDRVSLMLQYANRDV